jgi:hypothetical protein
VRETQFVFTSAQQKIVMAFLAVAGPMAAVPPLDRMGRLYSHRGIGTAAGRLCSKGLDESDVHVWLHKLTFERQRWVQLDQSLENRQGLRNRGGTNTNSAHRRIAVVEGIAERTPKARAS